MRKCCQQWNLNLIFMKVIVSYCEKSLLKKMGVAILCLMVLMRVFPADMTCPDVCLCIDNYVDCSGRGLVSLPSGLDFDTLELDLSHNSLTRVPQELIKLRNLTKLNLSDNKITMIGYGDLDSTPHLKYLDLSFNMLHDSREVKFSEFAHLIHLEELNLSYNSMKKITPFPSPKLKKLIINNCSLMIFDMGAVLEKMPNLTELNASSNHHLVNLSVSHSKSLQVLDLSDCNLKIIHSYTFANLSALQYLYFRRNKNLKKFHCISPSIQVLDLSDCNLETIPSGDLNGVMQANFHGNHFRSVSRNAFQSFSSLAYLDLSNNAISILERNAFAGLSELKEIDLSYNTLTNMNVDIFKENKKIKKVKLSHNYFTNMLEFESESLTNLDLSACEISSISSDSLVNMPRLQILNLSRNLIPSLPDYLEGDHIFKLDLSLCHITSINNKTFTRLLSLRSLKLSGNRMTYVHPNYFPQVFFLDIKDNPWRCDCKSLKPMYEWFFSAGQRTDNLLCQSPEKFEGFTWLQACSDEWNKNTIKKDTVWWYSVALIATMLLVLISVMVLRKIYRLKEKRLREAEAARRAEEREALRRMRRLQQETGEEINRNAPDPRELQRPPSYHEALLLPRLDSSHPSLSGSVHSIASRQSAHASNPDVTKKTRVRRKRRRKSDLAVGQRASRVTVDSDTSTDGDRPPRPQPLQSDF